jgi:N-ethylmaleimide reductase
MGQKAISLFDGVRIGDLELRNRIVMAPMTRSRAGDGDAPTALAAEYYRQRAEAGLIVTEGAQPSPTGKGYCRTPGIYSERQVAGWKQVTEAVRGEGGRIVLQITHGGRIGHPFNKEAGSELVAPSAIQAKGQIFTDRAGMVDFVMPRALDREEIPGVIEELRQATRNALLAGFDGVELHSASGYLPMQFLSTGTNRRTDDYGGGVTNRIRFVVEVLEAMASVDGAGRVGIRICPGTRFNDIHDENPSETYTALLGAIDRMGLAYLHVIRSPDPEIDAFALARGHFRGPLIANDGFSFETGEEFVRAGRADLVSYGRFFIANPDLVRRFREGAPLADFDPKTLYTPGPKGYIDYPTLA